MIKEHKLYTRSDRTSCHRWEANQFRLFEPPRDCRRLQLLRGWSYDKENIGKIFT